MTGKKIKALTFDTGGTILDWHTGFYNALSEMEKKYKIKKDWHKIANELRRRSLARILNQGEMQKPKYNFDEAHRVVLDELCKEYELNFFSEEDRLFIAWTTPHNFKVWADFPDVLPELRKKFICCSFTILSFRIIVDTARKNDLSWDSVFSCEGIGKYKILPEPYERVANWLQLDPAEICMVACHNFDLDAAKAVGFKTAFVKRPDEWGPAGPPDPEPNPEHDIIVDTFPDLARALSEQH
jgi:2-haloacid dehalogenase